jgi:outer membrane protein W
MKNKISLLVVIGSLISSGSIMAQEYDNYYVEYMYENYVGKGRARPVEFDIMEQQLQENKNIIMPKVFDSKTNTATKVEKQENKQEKHSNENNFETTFYTQFNYGISKFDKYKTNFENYAMNSAKMKADSNEPFYGFALGWAFNNWNIEAEINKADYKKIETKDINKTFLTEYNQKIKSLSLGVNLIYNFVQASNNKFIPFIGAGLGYSQFKISDFGKVWALNGTPVVSGTVGATETNFETGDEKKDTWYAKALLGCDFTVQNNTHLILSLDYRIYDDIKTDNSLKLKDMSSFNTNIGLRLNF